MALFTINNLILLCCFTFFVGFGLLATALERRGLKKSFYIWVGLLLEVVMIEALVIFNFLQRLPSNYNYTLSIIGGLQVSLMVSSLFFPQLGRNWVARLFRLPRTKLYVALVLLLLFALPLGIPVGALILTIQELPTTYRALLGYVVALVFGILSLGAALKAPAERRRRLLFFPVIMLISVVIITIYVLFNLYMRIQHGT